MDPEQKPAAGGEPQQRRIPNTDMQPEDTGTAESGNEDEGRAAAEAERKQGGKTEQESGERR